jgi:hypothetical protein
MSRTAIHGGARRGLFSSARCCRIITLAANCQHLRGAFTVVLKHNRKSGSTMCVTTEFIETSGTGDFVVVRCFVLSKIVTEMNNQFRVEFSTDFW